MMKKYLLRIVDIIEEFLGVLFFIGMFCAVTVQIFYRYILGIPLIWPLELSMFCFIYVIYFGAAMAARKGTHIAFDLIYERFSLKVRAVISILSNILIILILLSLIPSSLLYIKFIGNISSSALGVPWGWILLIFPVGIIFIIIHISIKTVLQIKEWFEIRMRA